MKLESPHQRALRVIGYARVSSPEQADDSQALEQQIARLKEAGATEILADVESGSKDNRVEYQRLISLVLDGAIDEVVFTRIDRLTRSLAQLGKFIEMFENSGVNLRIIDQQLDLRTPTGKLMARLLGSVAEWETDLLSERVRHGKQYRIQKQQANESCPWGYVTLNKRYQLDQRPATPPPEENKPAFAEEEWSQILENYADRTVAEIARDCADIFFKERSLQAAVRHISQKYGAVKQPDIKRRKKTETTVPCWTPSGLRQWLTNSVLCGHSQYNLWATTRKNQKPKRNPEKRILAKDTHPDQRLLSEEEAAEIRHILATNLNMGGSNFNRAAKSGDIYRPYAYLSGLVYCYECGAKCTSKSSGQKYHYFVCRHVGAGCRNKGSAEKAKIEQSLVGRLVVKSRLMHEEASRAKSQSHKGYVLQFLQCVEQTSEVRERQKQLSSVGFENYLESEKRQPEQSKRLDDLRSKYRYLEDYPGFDPDIESKKQELCQEIQEEERTVQSLLRENVERIIFSGNNLLFWDALTDDAKVRLYPRMVHKIFIHKGEVKQINFKTEVGEEVIAL